MNSRERFERAMAHEDPDRVPFDIGGTPLTGMRPGVRKGLCELLGFAEDDDERLLEWAGTDFRYVGDVAELPGGNARKISGEARVDCWGIRVDRVDGEWQITGNPLRGASVDDLGSYPWPEARIDEDLLAGWEKRARELREQGRYVVVAGHPVYGILELGCWMCGYDDFFLKLAADTDFVRVFFDRILEIQLAVIEQYYAALGSYIDLTTSGDDFGSQNGPLISPAMFESLIAPCFSERIRRTKEAGRCRYWHHTCGSVADLLDEIVGCGVDILNPIQTSAAGMEPRSLKDRFGDRLVFWGGVDVQQFLPRATLAEIPAHVDELARVLGENGGYVMAPAHEIQDDVPAENVAAWVEAVQGR